LVVLLPLRRFVEGLLTKRATATQAQVRRNIKAARLEGLRIAGIRPDGTVIVRDGDIPLSPILDCGLDEPATSLSKWGDIEA
jgi:hypothetical protein